MFGAKARPVAATAGAALTGLLELYASCGEEAAAALAGDPSATADSPDGCWRRLLRQEQGAVLATVAALAPGMAAAHLALEEAAMAVLFASMLLQEAGGAVAPSIAPIVTSEGEDARQQAAVLLPLAPDAVAALGVMAAARLESAPADDPEAAPLLDELTALRDGLRGLLATVAAASVDVSTGAGGSADAAAGLTGAIRRGAASVAAAHCVAALRDMALALAPATDSPADAPPAIPVGSLDPAVRLAAAKDCAVAVAAAAAGEPVGPAIGRVGRVAAFAAADALIRYRPALWDSVVPSLCDAARVIAQDGPQDGRCVVEVAQQTFALVTSTPAMKAYHSVAVAAFTAAGAGRVEGGAQSTAEVSEAVGPLVAPSPDAPKPKAGRGRSTSRSAATTPHHPPASAGGPAICDVAAPFFRGCGYFGSTSAAEDAAAVESRVVGTSAGTLPVATVAAMVLASLRSLPAAKATAESLAEAHVDGVKRQHHEAALRAQERELRRLLAKQRRGIAGVPAGQILAHVSSTQPATTAGARHEGLGDGTFRAAFARAAFASVARSYRRLSAAITASVGTSVATAATVTNGATNGEKASDSASMGVGAVPAAARGRLSRAQALLAHLFVQLPLAAADAAADELLVDYAEEIARLPGSGIRPESKPPTGGSQTAALFGRTDRATAMASQALMDSGAAVMAVTIDAGTTAAAPVVGPPPRPAHEALQQCLFSSFVLLAPNPPVAVTTAAQSANFIATGGVPAESAAPIDVQEPVRWLSAAGGVTATRKQKRRRDDAAAALHGAAASGVAGEELAALEDAAFELDEDQPQAQTPAVVAPGQALAEDTSARGGPRRAGAGVYGMLMERATLVAIDFAAGGAAASSLFATGGTGTPSGQDPSAPDAGPLLRLLIECPRVSTAAWAALHALLKRTDAALLATSVLSALAATRPAAAGRAMSLLLQQSVAPQASQGRLLRSYAVRELRDYVARCGDTAFEGATAAMSSGVAEVVAAPGTPAAVGQLICAFALAELGRLATAPVIRDPADAAAAGEAAEEVDRRVAAAVEKQSSLYMALCVLHQPLLRHATRVFGECAKAPNGAGPLLQQALLRSEPLVELVRLIARRGGDASWVELVGCATKCDVPSAALGVHILTTFAAGIIKEAAAIPHTTTDPVLRRRAQRLQHITRVLTSMASRGFEKTGDARFLVPTLPFTTIARRRRRVLPALLPLCTQPAESRLMEEAMVLAARTVSPWLAPSAAGGEPAAGGAAAATGIAPAELLVFLATCGSAAAGLPGDEADAAGETSGQADEARRLAAAVTPEHVGAGISLLMQRVTVPSTAGPRPLVGLVEATQALKELVRPERRVLPPALMRVAELAAQSPAGLAFVVDSVLPGLLGRQAWQHALLWEAVLDFVESRWPRTEGLLTTAGAVPAQVLVDTLRRRDGLRRMLSQRGSANPPEVRDILRQAES